MKQLKFDSNSPSDRREAFVHLCKTNGLDMDKEAEKHKIENPPAGLNVTIEKLFLFLYKNKMKGSFDFDQKEILVSFVEKPVTGQKAVNKPETIPDTPVDDSGGSDDDEDPDLPF